MVAYQEPTRAEAAAELLAGADGRPLTEEQLFEIGRWPMRARRHAQSLARYNPVSKPRRDWANACGTRVADLS